MKIWLTLVISLLFAFTSCKFTGDQQAATKKAPKTETSTGTHPEWILQSNVYEVNIRQYTPEGTFRAFAPHFSRLKAMGVDILWLMPVTPISKYDRKGTLGSYYAVADYTSINPEFGTMEDFKWFVNEAHKQGFKVITDWVANHTGADHPWVNSHPEFYNLDSTGKPKSVYDWTDTRELNFDNKAMRDSMTAFMKFWINETGIDGYRCDVAGEVPDDYWAEVIPQLRKLKTIFMLAEGERPSLHTAGFDASYPWEMFHTMKLIAKGESNAPAIDTVLWKYDSSYPKDAAYLYFTSNHDENSWNKSDFETFPGKSHAPFAVLTQTLKGSLPLIYSGQEEPVLRAISFFEKDSMSFNKLERDGFYRTLLELRKRNPAMAINTSFIKIPTGSDSSTYAFLRRSGGQKVLVVVNLDDQPRSIAINQKDIEGNVKEIFSGRTEKIGSTYTLDMEPWGYRVYEYVK